LATWRQKSYTELPALSVRRDELRRSLKIVTAGYVFCMLSMSCCSGSHVKVLFRMIGFEDFHFGLMASVAYAATLGQLLAAVLIERTGLTKFQFIHCMMISRLLWLAVAAVPLILPIPSRLALYTTLMVLLGLSFASSLASPAWITWMGDMIPKRIRGRYLGYRERLGRIARLPCVIAIGILLDAATVAGAPERRDAQPLLFWITCAILAVGAVLGTIDIVLFYRIREVVPSRSAGPVAPRTPRLRELLWDPLKDRVFRRYVLYGATITFAVSVGGWFFWLNGMENLGFGKLAMNVLFLAISPVSGMLAAKWWGKLIDSWGRRPVLILATFGTLFSISHWFFITRHTPAPGFLVDAANWCAGSLGWLVGKPGWVWVTPETPFGAYLIACAGCIIGGAAWTGVMLAQTGVMLGFADGRGRSKYVAASAALLGIAGTLGGVVAGTVAAGLKHLQDAPLGPFLWNNWHAVFAISLLARMMAVLWLIRMPDPGSRPFRHMVRLMGANVYNAVTPRLFYRLRVFGWGRRSSNGKTTDGTPRQP